MDFGNFCHGTNVGAASPKALVFKGMVVKKEGIKWVSLTPTDRHCSFHISMWVCVCSKTIWKHLLSSLAGTSR
jgi:hypothetical protein